MEGARGNFSSLEVDVAVKTEFAGELPAHLNCWDGGALGRSDTIVALVTAPASNPSLRKLPRSIQFQGQSVSISVSRSLHSKSFFFFLGGKAIHYICETHM